MVICEMPRTEICCCAIISPLSPFRSCFVPFSVFQELIPEFYAGDGSFLTNADDLQLGVTQVHINQQGKYAGKMPMGSNVTTQRCNTIGVVSWKYP